MKMKLTVVTVMAMTAIGIQTATAGRVAWAVGIGPVGVAGGPACAPAPVYAPPPVYVQPAPVYVQPAPVVVTPPPVYVAPPPVCVPTPVVVAPRPFFGFRIALFGGHHHHR